MIQRPPVRFTQGAGAAPKSPPPRGEALILYYSRSGATELAAQRIATHLGAELRSLTPDSPSRLVAGSLLTRLRRTVADFRAARSEEARLGVRGIDLSGRRLIVIGTPVWLGAPAPPVAELLSSADFTGCSVVMLFTYGARLPPAARDACRDAIRRRGGRYLGYLALHSGEGEAARHHLLEEVDAALCVHAASWRHQASLEVMARRDAPTASSSLLVTLRAQGDRPPLFIVSSTHGDVLALSGLSQRVDPNQPVYALQPPIDIEPEVAGSVAPDLHRTRLARDYADALLAVLGEDRRPCRLAGYSAGCLLAAAVAERLRAVGRPVEQLILLEPPPPLWMFDQQVYSWMKRLVRRYYPRTDRRLPRPLHVYHAYFTDEGFAHTLHAAIEYTPQRCASRVTLVLAEDALLRFSRRRLGWRRVGLEPVAVRRVPGDHFSFLRRPHVDELGQTLRELLAQGDSKTMERA